MNGTLALSAPRIAPAWRWPLAAFAVYELLVLWAFWDTGVSMVSIWDNSVSYTHAYLVPPIALWLAWRLRHRLAALAPRPAPWAVALLLPVATLWWLGSLASVNAAMHFALVGMLVAGVPALLGWTVARTLLFPLAFLFFAVPFGEFLTPVMMDYTADFTVAALRASGVPVYREGLQFVIPSGHWSVVEACSGIRYLMASVMVGSLFAYLNYQSWQRRTAFVALSIIVPIVANWVRAYMIVMLGHLSNNTIATGVDHLVYGWVFFGVIITALFMVGARWAQPDPLASMALAAPLSQGADRGVDRPQLALVLVLLSFAVLWPRALQQTSPASSAAPVIQLPVQLSANWRVHDADINPWRPRFMSPAAEINRSYISAQGAVGVHIAYYRQQSDTSKLISSQNALVSSDDTKWRQLSSQLLQTGDAGKPLAWRASTLRDAQQAPGLSGSSLRVWQAYWVGDALTASDSRGKLMQAWAKARGLPDDAAAIFLLTDQQGNPEDADKRLAGFAAANLGAIVNALAQARDVR